MTSNVATTVATVPMSNNNTKALVEDCTSADAELEQTTPSNAVASSSRETAVDESDVGRDGEEMQPAASKSFGFFAIIAALAFLGLLTSLEATITSTALPTITADLGGAELFKWVVNGYYLTRTAFQPLFGQLANIYGRRWPMISVTAAFTLGIGLSGGVGAGGINVLIEIIVCNLLPLRERGRYLGIMFGVIALGRTLGPLFGGLIVQHISWRWVFYLNVSIGGVALVTLVAFLKVKSDDTPNYMLRLKRIDWLGNIIFVLSMVSVLIALSWLGSKYPWSSFRIIVPLVVGFGGGVLFMFFEASRYCINPTMPIHLFSNQTLSAMSVMYFLPVYFQGVLGVTPSRAGIELFPTILFMIPSAITAGGLLSRFGRYRPIQHVGFTLMVIGFVLLTLLKADATTAQWVSYQLASAAGTGLVLPVLLPAVQASLTEADTVLSASTWALIRSFGLIWGATIPTAAFDSRFNTLLYRITDPVIAEELANGSAYEHATKSFMDTITDPVTRAQVVSVYVNSLKTVWFVSMAFAVLAFLLVILEKEIPLRKELETNFSMEEKAKSTKTGQSCSEELPPTSV